MPDREERREQPGQQKEFAELLKYTAAGFAGGLTSGFLLDHFGFQRSAIGQWLVRTLSGEGESLFEGAYAIRQRLRDAHASMAEAYGWGKFLGMVAPWIIDWASRLAGVDLYGVEGFYVPYFYAMSDQIGANVSGLIFLRRQQGTWWKAVSMYARNAVMLASVIIILAAPLGLVVARLLGFSPGTQLQTALETIAANLCWVPPLIGWMKEKRE